MNFTGLKRSTTLKSYEKEYRKLKDRQVNMPNRIQKIGILASSRLFGSYDITRNLSKKIGVDSKHFEVIIFENLKDEFVAQHYNTFTEKDFGMYGKFKANNLVDFVKSEYDLLINYCNPESVFANLIVVRSKAKFKVSFDNELVNDMYNFTISVGVNKVDVFNDELAKYLQIFKLIK